MSFVYRHFDKNGTLLYIGCTFNMYVRTMVHKSKSKWYPDISRIEFDKYDNKKAAQAAEKEAIKKENPLHNIWHTDKLQACFLKRNQRILK